MKEIEKNEQQIDNPTITETPESVKETESKKAQFGSSLDSFSSTGATKRQEGNIAQSETKENPEHKADTEKAVVTKSSSDTPEERKENLGAKLDKLSTDGSEKDNAYINAMNNMSDYLNKHNYGREDYAEYSKDPEWQKLNADLQRSLGMEVTSYEPEEARVLSKEEAMGNMANYLSEHNYGPDDYAEYSKDPEWQKLNADLQRSLGMEVTSYEPEAKVPEETEKEKIPEVQESVKAFESSNWEKLSQVEKEQAVETLCNSVAEELGIQEKPEVSFYYSANKSECGYFDPETNQIMINSNGFDDPVELADTAAHEMRHCWQHERAENPQTQQDVEFKENFDNYITPEENIQKYLNQPVEKDARLYANSVAIQIPGYEDALDD